jgi:hypothetical protein
MQEIGVEVRAASNYLDVLRERPGALAVRLHNRDREMAGLTDVETTGHKG